MTTRHSTSKWLEIDRFVEALEEAYASTGSANIHSFVPPPDHPFRVAILCEMVRVDLELSWGRGNLKALEDYLAEFPCLQIDPEARQQLAYEHYRQRGNHGERPAPQEYAVRFQIDTSDWSQRAGVEHSGALPARDSRQSSDSSEHDLAEEFRVASLAYEQYLSSQERDDPESFRSFCASLPTPASIADLFRDLHGSDPQIAWRLARSATTFPNIGQSFQGFQLVAVLGQGAFSRVYLAHQKHLAGRQVVLKISADLMGESQMLAQLQHTHIVPVYSVHRSPPLQAVCMPYFGATTLADVIKELHDLSNLPNSGKHFTSTIHGRQGKTVVAVPDVSGEKSNGATLESSVPNWPDTNRQAEDMLDRLENSTYIEAVLDIGARLADGLAHAHARGIYHHDLKPANILLADDGRPMLLDFNLAEDTKLRKNPTVVRVGGTLPYMAPEQLHAFQGEAVVADGRSDIYSLGLILFELLAGRPSFALPSGSVAEVLPLLSAERQKPPPDIRRFNPSLSPAVEAILRRCLQPRPEDRYATAAQLKEDLDRQRTHQVLKYTPEPSLRERFSKWRCRHPRLSSATSVGLLAAALLVFLGAMTLYLVRQVDRHQAREQMTAFLDEKERLEIQARARGGDAVATDTFRVEARALLDRYLVPTNPQWQEGPAVRNLDDDSRQKLKEEIGYVTFLLSVEERRRGSREEEAQVREKTLQDSLHLDEIAIRCFRPEECPVALLRHRDEVRQFLQLPPLNEVTRKADDDAPRSARDAYLLASSLHAQGKYGEALGAAQLATRLAPRWFVAQFLLGMCHLELAQDSQADQAMSTCIALWPEFPWSYYSRGLARMRLGMLAAARKDFDVVLEARPEFGPVYTERALVRQAERDFPGAIADLNQALSQGVSAAKVHFLRAQVHTLAGNAAAAQKDKEAGMRLTPSDESDWVARGMARLPEEKTEALGDFDQALALNPRSCPARQNKAYVLSELLNKVPESVTVLDSVIRDFPGYLPSLRGRAVLLARLGKRQLAHVDAETALRLSKSSETLYQIAGVYAQTSREAAGDRAVAYRLLASAFADRGYGLDFVDHDADLNPVRDQAEFRRIVTAARILHSAANRQ